MWFFELSGVLVNRRMIDQNLYFEIFNPTPFWKAKPIIEGMRNGKSDSHYENFESLNTKRLSWKKKRSKNSRSRLSDMCFSYYYSL